jgi:hypothetical protein
MTWCLVALSALSDGTSGEKIALGNFREPPVLMVPGRTRDRANVDEDETRPKAAPLQTITSHIWLVLNRI